MKQTKSKLFQLLSIFISMTFLFIVSEAFICYPKHQHDLRRKPVNKEAIKEKRYRSVFQSTTSLLEFPLFSVPVGMYNIPGEDPDRPNKVNQDAYFHASFQYERSGKPITSTYAGVLDGHGLKGHLVSRFMAHQMPFRIQEQFAMNDSSSNTEDFLVSNVPSMIKAAFENAHEDAIQNKTIPAGRSGTTCVMMMLEESDQLEKEDLNSVSSTISQTMYIANVGDSRAVIGIPPTYPNSDFDSFKTIHKTNNRIETSAHVSIEIKKSSPINDSQMWKALALTKETTVKIPEENERIEMGEGRVDSMGNVFYGPVGISMTRALGDAVMLRAGVIPSPIVDCFQIIFEKDSEKKNNRKCGMVVVLGSDGIFDVMKNEEVIDYAVKSMTTGNDMNDSLDISKINAAAESIAKEAKQRWQGGLPLEVKSDDITCAVIVI